MKKTYLPILLICALNACQNTTVNSEVPWDYCISGGTIYTALDSRPTVEAIAVRNGKISYVGSNARNWCDLNTSPTRKVVDLKNNVLYPGFTDAHGHLLGIGLREMTLNLEGTTSIKDLQKRLKKAASNYEPNQTIYGRGWIETHWPENRFPNRYDLDKIVPDQPVILERSDGHAYVVNSKTLQLANITKNTESPFGGSIKLDKNGKPTGMLIDNAGKLVTSLIAEITPEQREQAYIKGSELYASRGWTNIHSMSVDPDDVALLNSLANDEKIKIRIYNSVDLLDARSMPSFTSGNPKESDLITTRAIKLYSDGALGSRGAALLQPYADEPSNEGLMTLKEVQAESILEAALRSGTQVNIHAIGDRANRMVLQWYKNAFENVPETERSNPDPRWRIEHSQIIHTDDIPLFSKYGIIPSMQPSHAIGDLHFAVDRLGKDRLAGGYAWRSLIDSGSIIAGGTDAPVEIGDPLIEFYAATQRKDLNGYSNDAWYPEQKVTPQEALKMFTAWPAYAAFQDNNLGTIEVGKSADFTIFDTDIMIASGADILNAAAVMTIVDGKIIYER